MSYIKERLMYPIKQMLMCDKCDVEMECGTYTTHTYICPVCGKVERLEEEYPRVIYLDGTPLSNSGLSWRAYNSLKEQGVRTIEELNQKIEILDGLPMIVKSEVRQLMIKRGMIADESRKKCDNR